MEQEGVHHAHVWSVRKRVASWDFLASRSQSLAKLKNMSKNENWGHQNIFVFLEREWVETNVGVYWQWECDWFMRRDEQAKYPKATNMSKKVSSLSLSLVHISFQITTPPRSLFQFFVQINIRFFMK